MTAYFAMRGYFTFLIVLAACLLIVSLFQFNINSKYSNTGRAIWVERYHQTEMNVKEAIVEAAREGVIEGTLQYAINYVSKCLPAATTPETSEMAIPSTAWLEKCINDHVYNKIVSLDKREVDGMKIKLSLSSQYDPDSSQPSCPYHTPSLTCADSEPDINNLIVEFNDLGSNSNSGIPTSSPLDVISYMGKNNDTPANITDVNKAKDILGNYFDIHIKGNIISIDVSRDDIGEVSFTMPQAEVKIG